MKNGLLTIGMTALAAVTLLIISGVGVYNDFYNPFLICQTVI